MGNTIDASYGRTAQASADSDDQGVMTDDREMTEAQKRKAKEDYAIEKQKAFQAHEKYKEENHGGSFFGNHYYNDEDYLPPAQYKIFKGLQEANDRARARDVSAGAVAVRSTADTATMGLTELAYDAGTYGTGEQSWAENASENRENREAAERLHPWASRAGTAVGVAGWCAIGWESGAAKAVVSGGGAALRVAGVGAAMGAVNGATHNDGSVQEATAGAGVGALAGGATGVIGAKLTELAAPYVSKFVSTIASTELRRGLKPLQYEEFAHLSGRSANWEAEATARAAANGGAGADGGNLAGRSAGDAAGREGAVANPSKAQPTIGNGAPAAIGSATARFGKSIKVDYKGTFFSANPALKGKVVVHHAVEQQTLARFPGVVTKSEMHSLENLRGIPKGVNSDVHLSKIRREWNQFYRTHPNPTKRQLLDKATEIDRKYGSHFNPPR
ncbi:MAG: hypothetical protein FWD68_13215 [Alphaproteobacteria bacterium]|nr:hypothetical protein [Alphaproteobacteria bacterium]